jgi:hypothetical protein
MPNFSVTTDVAVLAAFVVVATGLACLRFSQESRYSPRSSTCWLTRTQGTEGQVLLFAAPAVLRAP